MSKNKSYDPRKKSFALHKKNKPLLDLPLIEVRAEKWVPGGDCLARHEGKVVFVSGAIPGELVSVKLSEEKKDFSKGSVVDVIERSPDRAEVFCEVYNECGGCSMQHLKYDAQVKARKIMVEDGFKRVGGIDIVDIFGENWDVFTGQEKKYRIRAKFHKAIINKKSTTKKQKTIWGFKKENSHKVCDATKCKILAPAISNFIIQLSSSAKNTEMINDAKIDYVNVLTNSIEKSSGDSKKLKSVHDIKVLDSGIEKIKFKICGKSFFVDARNFFQSNLEILPKLVDFIKKNVNEISLNERDSAIDLFSGVGFFSAFLEDEFKKVYAVERDDKCLKYSKKNTAENVESISADANLWMKTDEAKDCNLLLVDPPRLGLAKDLMHTIIKLKPANMIYVSCNPITLARDLKSLTKIYDLSDISGFDFYPQTPHLEMAVVLKLKKS